MAVTTDYPDRLITHLRRWMSKNDCDGLHLAERAGISSPTLYNLLNGKILNPKPGTLRKLASVTGDKPEWLFELAGILPGDEDEETDDVVENVWRMLARLPEDRREEAIRLLETYVRMVEDEARQATTAARNRKAKAT